MVFLPPTFLRLAREALPGDLGSQSWVAARHMAFNYHQLDMVAHLQEGIRGGNGVDRPRTRPLSYMIARVRGAVGGELPRELGRAAPAGSPLRWTALLAGLQRDRRWSRAGKGITGHLQPLWSHWPQRLVRPTQNRVNQTL